MNKNANVTYCIKGNTKQFYLRKDEKATGFLGNLCYSRKRVTVRSNEKGSCSFNGQLRLEKNRKEDTCLKILSKLF